MRLGDECESRAEGVGPIVSDRGGDGLNFNDRCRWILSMQRLESKISPQPKKRSVTTCFRRSAVETRQTFQSFRNFW
jgi:hypothetical protein